MSKKTKKTNPKCEDHFFSLKPLQNFCKFTQTISASYCDPSKHKPKTIIQHNNRIECRECPIFNKDKNFATPTFILRSQREHYDSNGPTMRQQHEKKMVEYTDEKEELNLPKPRTKNNYCNVCRQCYEDYLHHIQCENHKKNIRNSSFNKSIMELTQKFNSQSKILLNCNHQALSTQNDNYVELIESMPKKKIKTNEQPRQAIQNSQQYVNSQIPIPNQFNFNPSAYCTNFPIGTTFLPNSMYGFPNTTNLFPSSFGYDGQQFLNGCNIYPNSQFGNPQFGMFNDPWISYISQLQRENFILQGMQGQPYQNVGQNCYPINLMQSINEMSQRNATQVPYVFPHCTQNQRKINQYEKQGIIIENCENEKQGLNFDKKA